MAARHKLKSSITSGHRRSRTREPKQKRVHRQLKVVRPAIDVRPRLRQTMLLASQERRTKRVHCLVADTVDSAFNGEPVNIVVYCLDKGSLNRKTGPVINVAFMPIDEPPHVAVKSGADRAVCGDCIHRPLNNGTCYVVTPRHLPAVWKAAPRATSHMHIAGEAIAEAGVPIRIGSWGDPACARFEDVLWLAYSAGSTADRPRHIGYTHAWRSCDQRFKDLLMASVNSPAEREEARRLGWKTFRIRTVDMPVLKGERICPASPEGGRRTTCSVCLACSGSNARHDIVVIGHGSANKVNKLDRLLRLRLRKDDLRATDAVEVARG